MKLPAIAALLLVLPQQNPTSQQPSDPKGSIEGIVVHAGTNEPIVGARVTLVRVQTPPTALPAIPGAPAAPVPNPPAGAAAPLVGPQTNPGVNTDSLGKFVFKDVEAGTYNVNAARNGFARGQYGERRVGAQDGKPVSVAAAQPLKDLVIRLTPAGFVSGRIRDLTGQPVAGVQVQLFKAAYNATGQRTFQSAGSTRTNDRGEYRLYWVTPGRYYLNAGSTQGAPVNIGGGGASPNEVQDVYVSTYYPNVTDMSLAAALNVQPGNEISGIDLAIDRQQLYRIRGRVIDTRTDRPPMAATFSVTSRSFTGGGFTMFGGQNQRYNNSDGSFELRDMAPGTYVIGAQVTETSGILSSPSAPNQPRAQAPVTVVNADVENVMLTIFPPLSLPGRLSIEGQPLTALTSLDRMRVQLQLPTDAAPLGPGTQAQSQPISADGSFRIENLLPGDYRVAISGLPPGYYVKAARLEQLDVLEPPFRVPPSASGPLDVMISPNGGQIDGTILDSKQQPVRDTQAILIPDRARNRSDLYSTARSDQNGRFTFRGIPPGDYKVFAWEVLEPFGYYDPDLIRLYEARGNPVHVTESSSQSVEVRIIPASEP